MNVAILGTGYVGLTTGLCLAYVGHDVTCVDVDAGKVDQLCQGIPPIHEPGLSELMKATSTRRRGASRLSMARHISLCSAPNSTLQGKNSW